MKSIENQSEFEIIPEKELVFGEYYYERYRTDYYIVFNESGENQPYIGVSDEDYCTDSINCWLDSSDERRLATREEIQHFEQCRVAGEYVPYVKKKVYEVY